MQNHHWSETTKRWVILGALLLIALAFYRFQRILTPVIVALILAYVLNPAVSLLERRLCISRTLAAVVAFLLLLGVISLIPVLVVPALVQQVRDLNLNIQEMLNFITSLFRNPIVIGGLTINASQLYNSIVAGLESLLSSFATSSVNVLLSIASGVAWSVIVLVLAFWLVKDAPFLRQSLAQIAPLGYQRDLRLLGQQIVAVWKAFFRGQLLLILAVGVAVALAMTIVGLPFALLMGLIAGILELIPNIGPVVAAVPAVLIALTRGSNYLPLSPFWFAVLVTGLYIVIQQLENNLLVPRIMGGALNMHPLVVLIGILLGANLAGILGIFLAAPALATLRVLARYIYRRLLDQEPFPEAESVPKRELTLPVGSLKKDDVKAVLFDLDGTLIDSDDAMILIWSRRLRHVDWLFPHRKPERFLRQLIMHGEVWANRTLILLDVLGLERAVFAIREWWMKTFRVKRSAFLPVQGAPEMLDALRQRYRLGVVTTRNRRDTVAFLDQIHRDGLFDVLVTRESVRRLKPHPEPILKAARALGLSPQETIMVGDTSLDMRSAKAAGAQAVGVLCGLGMVDDLERADLIIAHTSDLAPHLLDEAPVIVPEPAGASEENAK